METSDRCYVIAEIGVNHNGSVEMARQLIDVAARAGADAVKFQTFAAEDLVTKTARKATYQARNTGEDGSQFEMLARLELDESEFADLLEYCGTQEIDFLSTPFGPAQADLLERIGVTAFKVSSGDLTYHQFLQHLARKKLPIILSTGMATLAEIDDALRAIDEAAEVPVSLLHCVSDYPAAIEDCNLRAIGTMAAAFGRPIGWSDHTIGSDVGLAAVALGARILEKHITLDTSLDGPDHAASMEPADFVRFVAGIRAIESSLGDGVKRPRPSELRTAEVARRSVVAVRDLAPGQVIGADDVDILRPGTGLPPSLLDAIVGCRVAVAVEAGHPLTFGDLHG